jgi:hypothetical protein
VEDSPESLAEQEQASSGVSKRKVSGASAPPRVRDDGSLDYDGIYFILQLLIYMCQKKIE